MINKKTVCDSGNISYNKAISSSTSLCNRGAKED
jgi:hypothetical protein